MNDIVHWCGFSINDGKLFPEDFYNFNTNFTVEKMGLRTRIKNAEGLKCTCTKRGCTKFMKKQALLLATVVSVVLGIVLGILMRFAELSKLDIAYFAFPGDLFVRMLKMVIVPIIITSLVSGETLELAYCEL